MQEIFLRPLSTKTTEFEVKNRCKSAEETKQDIYWSKLVLFEGNKPHFSARNEHDKLVIVGGSNNAESGGGAPSRRRQAGVRGRSPWRCGDFLQFFPKNRRREDIWHIIPPVKRIHPPGFTPLMPPLVDAGIDSNPIRYHFCWQIQRLI